MPKEYAHWRLAEATLERAIMAPGAEALLRAAEEHRSSFYLGAVAPDILFYYLSGHARSEFSRVSRSLHGENGEDTLAPVKRLALRFRSAGQDAAAHVMPERFGGASQQVGFERYAVEDLAAWQTALLFGYITHVMTDSVFHPLVYYYAGQALEDHFAFETALDFHYLEARRLFNRGRVVELFRSLRSFEAVDSGELEHFLGRLLFQDQEYDRAAFSTCLSRYRLLQSAFFNPAAALLADVLGAWIPALRPYASSFYRPRLKRYRILFRGALRFRHPVSGEEVETDLIRLERETAERALAAAGRILVDGRADVTGPGLDTGLPGPRAEMRHFLEGGFRSLPIFARAGYHTKHE